MFIRRGFHSIPDSWWLWAGGHYWPRCLGLGCFSYFPGFVLEIFSMVQGMRMGEPPLQNKLKTSGGFGCIFLEPVKPKGLDGCAKPENSWWDPSTLFTQSPLAVFRIYSINTLFFHTHDMLHGYIAGVGGDGVTRGVDDGLFHDAHIARPWNEAFAPARNMVGLGQQASCVQTVLWHSSR